MFAQGGETGDDDSETKDDNRKRGSFDLITCNDCGEKVTMRKP